MAKQSNANRKGGATQTFGSNNIFRKSNGEGNKNQNIELLESFLGPKTYSEKYKMSLKTKITILESCIFPVTTYGAQS